MTEPSITLTLGELADANTGLLGVLALELPSKTAYHVAKLARLANPDIREYFEQHKALVVKMGIEQKSSDEGDAATYKVAKDKLPEFNRQLNELRATPVTLAYGPITMTMLDGFNIAGAHLVSLGPLLLENQS